MPLIERLQLRDFMCFRELDLRLGPFTVVVGPNDSGKTTLLRALMAIQGLTGQPDWWVTPERHLGVGSIRRAGAARDHVRLTVEGTGPAGAYEVDVHLAEISEGHAPATSTMRVGGHSLRLVAPADGSATTDLPGYDLPPGLGGAGVLAARLPEGKGRARDWARSVTAIQATLHRVAVVRLDPAVTRAPSFAAASRAVPWLDERGDGLPTALSVLAATRNEAYGRIKEAFRNALPGFADVGVVPGNVTRPVRTFDPRGEATWLEREGPGHQLEFVLANGETLDATDVSDGAILFLAFLTLMEHPDPPSVILVEEPENGVHPSRVRDVLHVLRSLTEPTPHRPGVQVIVTTHSPYLLDGVRLDEAVFCTRDEQGDAVAARFDAIPDLVDQLNEFSLGELWTAYGEQNLLRMARTGPA